MMEFIEQIGWLNIAAAIGLAVILQIAACWLTYKITAKKSHSRGFAAGVKEPRPLETVDNRDAYFEGFAAGVMSVTDGVDEIVSPKTKPREKSGKTKDYNEGYEKGFRDGEFEGRSNKWDWAVASARIDGFNEGFRKGYDEALSFIKSHPGKKPPESNKDGFKQFKMPDGVLDEAKFMDWVTRYLDGNNITDPEQREDWTARLRKKFEAKEEDNDDE